MKVSCAKNEIGPALISLCRLIPSRTNLPILNGCLISASDQTLTLQCTDLELTLTISIPAQVEEEGSTVVFAKYLSDLVRKLPVDDVSLSWTDEKKLLEVNYGSAVSHLHTWQAADYPPLQQTPCDQKINFQGSKWKGITEKVLSAAAQQDVRINYAGVFVQFLDEQIHMAATDAYRLALIKIPNNSGIKGCDLFIPGRALTEVNRLAADGDDLEISWDSGMISFATRNFVLTSRLINAQFPNYEKVIPEKPELKIEIPRDILMTTLERASLFVPPQEHYAVANLKIEDDKLVITAQAVEVGSLQEVIFLNEPTGSNCDVTFNAKYLLEPLQVMDQEKITLCLNGQSGPAVYLEEGEDEYYLHLVSPVCRVS